MDLMNLTSNKADDAPVSLALMATNSESRVPQAVLSRSTDGSYYPRMDNRRPRISSYSPSSRSSTTRTPHRSQRPKKIVKSIWVKKGRVNGTYTLKQFGNRREISRTMLSLTVDALEVMTERQGQDKECLILSPKFKFVDEDLVILRAPRKNDVYSLDLKNIIPSGGITCLVAKQTEDEAVLWHRRLGHSTQNIQQVNSTRHLARRLRERTVKNLLNAPHGLNLGPFSVESINKKKEY
ncbi:hypothetical protein Tco_1547189 [Tanacetum coccineum]